MNRLPHSSLKNLPHYKLQHKTHLRLIIVILVTLWPWPVAAGSNSGTDDDAARKRATNNAKRSAPQHVQPVQPTRSSFRDTTSQPSSLPSRTFASPQPSFTPPSTTGSSRGTIQFHSDSQARSFDQPAINRKIEAPKFELTADTSKSTDRSNDNSDQRPGRQDTRQRVQGNVQGANPAGTGQTNQNTRSGGTGRDTVITPAPGAKTFSLPSGGDKSGTSDIRQRFQGRGQIGNTPATNQNKQTLLSGASGDKSGSSTSGGEESSTSGKDANQPQNLQSSGTRPTISDIRTRLGDQGSDKGKLSGDADKLEKGKLPAGTGDKSDKISTKIGTVTGATTPVSPTNPANTKVLDDAKRRLGADDRIEKRGPADFNLGKTLETSPLKGKLGETGAGLNTKRLQLTQPLTGNTKLSRDDMLKSRFPDRLKSGELDKVTKGDVAQKVKLSDQFKLMPQGDVARRLELQKHPDGIVHVKDLHASDIHHLNNVNIINNVNDYYVDRPHYYHGLIGPAYANNCFRFAYFGPTFFAGACWYPSWNPWVAWSWNYHCHPIWDPRPIWCRPVIYDPYYNWVYWQTPVWAPMPIVQCGTWVDVQRPVLDVAQNDLQLLAVRFVDPGHPEEKLGPRYRVWFRNNGDQPVETPFNVMLFAGNDDKLTADLPRSGVRVKAIDPGDVQSVDIRLPLEATTMWRDADGKATPFQVLHVMVDANREIVDANPANNGAAIQRDEVLPIDPAAFEVDPAKLAAGSEMILAGEGLGPQPGQVLVNVGGRELQAEVLGWYDLGVRINVPQVEVSEPTPADVFVVRGDGAATNPVKITLLPAQAGPALNPPPPPPPAPAE
ncbi:MAG: hypothetical protein ABSE63_06735 [Thermoguttaceae bacterium]